MNETIWPLIQNIFMVSGGLGLFLFGMQIMSDGLNNLAGDRMRAILERITSNRFLGVLVGTFITAIIQSSSATTVMLVGFVNAGLMTLVQAVSVSMGAAIGTTITAQIVALKIDPFAPFIIFTGFLMYVVFKKRNIKNTGYILLGFGILFFGMSTMGVPLKVFAAEPSFKSVLSAFENPFLAFSAGLIFTCVIQSSSAATGIIITLIGVGTGTITFHTAVFLTMGSNIGTCITAGLASLAANREGKRLALAYTLFKIIGTIILGSVLLIFPGILNWFETTWPDSPKTQVAMYHTMFNTTITVMLVGFTGQLAWLARKIIPESPNETANVKRLIYLDAGTFKIPSTAITQARRELSRMGQITVDNLKMSIESLFTKNIEKAEKVLEIEKTIDFLNNEITSWLVKIRGLGLSESDIEKAGRMLHTVADIERLGDHAENIAEYTLLLDRGIKISPTALEELKTLSAESVKTVELALDIFSTTDETYLAEANRLEEQVDKLAKNCVESHIQRLKDEICDPRGGVIFTDMVIDLERCADHAINIAYSIVK